MFGIGRILRFLYDLSVWDNVVNKGEFDFVLSFDQKCVIFKK